MSACCVTKREAGKGKRQGGNENSREGGRKRWNKNLLTGCHKQPDRPSNGHKIKIN